MFNGKTKITIFTKNYTIAYIQVYYASRRNEECTENRELRFLNNQNAIKWNQYKQLHKLQIQFRKKKFNLGANSIRDEKIPTGAEVMPKTSY